MTALLTARQLEVLQCMARGLDARETARELGLKWHTVRDHQKGLYARLGVSSGPAAVYVAERDGLVEVPR